MKHILVTGATGFLGKETVRQLLEHTDHHLYLLVRSEPGKTAEERIKWIKSHRNRVTCIEGNIESKEIFQHDSDRKFCEETIDEILHMAASVEFREARRQEITSANLGGTQNLLAAARGFKRLSCFNHVSTAYVSGNRFSPDVIAETALDIPATGYRNPYEETKHQAESLVINSGLPWTIMRPSIIVGSVDGNYFGNNTMYSACHLLFNTRLMCMEELGYDAAARTDMTKKITLNAPFVARAHSLCNAINVDVAARMIIGIMNWDGKRGRFFHVCSPQATPLKTFLAPMFELLNIDGVSYVEKKDVNPQKLSPSASFLYHHFKTFSNYYLEDDPVFSMENTALALGKDFINSMPSFTEDTFRSLIQTFLVKAYPAHFGGSAPVHKKQRDVA